MFYALFLLLRPSFDPFHAGVLLSSFGIVTTSDLGLSSYAVTVIIP